MSNISELALKLTQNNDNMLALQHEISSRVAEFQNQLATAQERDTELREAIRQAMEKEGGTPYEDDNIKITYVKPGTRVGIDTTRLQLEQPDLFEQYKKITNVRSQVRIKVK